MTDPTQQIETIPASSDEADSSEAENVRIDTSDAATSEMVTTELVTTDASANDSVTSEMVTTDASTTGSVTGAIVAPQADTEPTPIVEPEQAPPHPGALPDLADPAPTEALDQVPDVVTAPANPLDSVPWQDHDATVAAHEPTVTMPASVAPTPFDPPATPHSGVPVTGEVAVAPSGALFDGAHDVNADSSYESQGFTLRASFVFAFLAMVATLMASIADVIDLRTSVPIDGISPGIRVLEDVGTNLAVGGYIGTALMLLGGLAACFGARWGAGLAGGAGLAVAGWAAMTIGLVERPLFEARTAFANVGAVPPGAVLTTTRSLGWFLIMAVGIVGGLVFLVSLRQAGTGGRRGLNPWVAALGALGTVVLAAGPLIPLGTADLSSNLGFDTEPRAFFLGRMIQLGLLVFTGVLGFLSVRTYGLGLAAGGLSIVIWMWATTLANVGSGPVGPALGNLGSRDTTPHAVTGVGVAVSVLMLAIAITIAVVSRPRPA